jgi:hypothetical protein
MKITITYPGSPYFGQEALVTRVRYTEHVDLHVTLEDSSTVTIDSTWTDYWDRKGERPPAARILCAERARVLTELLERLETRLCGSAEPDEEEEAG